MISDKITYLTTLSIKNVIEYIISSLITFHVFPYQPNMIFFIFMFQMKNLFKNEKSHTLDVTKREKGFNKKDKKRDEQPSIK